MNNHTVERMHCNADCDARKMGQRNVPRERYVLFGRINEMLQAKEEKEGRRHFPVLQQADLDDWKDHADSLVVALKAARRYGQLTWSDILLEKALLAFIKPTPDAQIAALEELAALLVEAIEDVKRSQA